MSHPHHYRHCLLFVAGVMVAGVGRWIVVTAASSASAASTITDSTDNTSSAATPTATNSSSSTNTSSSSASASSWAELDKRPVPAWYEEAKFGIFIHWGVFSVPSFRTEWFWYEWQHERGHEFVDLVLDTEKPNFAYPDYAHRFQAEFYDPVHWVTNIFAPSGAQYIVLTSKHHEGYCMWDSRKIPTTWNWNVMEVGPRRDLLGELATVIKRTKSPMTGQLLKFGAYHSLFEWFNPLFLQDQANNFTTSYFVDLKTGPELYDLVEKYEPELIWSDGEWSGPSSYWKAREFLSWYANNSTVAKTAVWNDRWGTDTLCKHGAYLTCQDGYRPGKVNARKWEQCNTIDQTSWGLNRNSTYAQYRTTKELIHMLIETVAFNGNFLLNVGPAADGTIHPIFVDRLLGIGEWLKVNGPAIYGTKPWSVCQNETKAGVFYTQKQHHHHPLPEQGLGLGGGGGEEIILDPGSEGAGQSVLFAHLTQWPRGNVVHLDCTIPTNQTHVYMLGVTNATGPVFLSWSHRRHHGAGGAGSGIGAGISITLPALTPDRIPCQHAWVLVITGIGNLDHHKGDHLHHDNNNNNVKWTEY